MLIRLLVKYWAKLATFAVLYELCYTNLFVCMLTQPIHVTARCPIRTTLELVGGKWKLLILHQLYQKTLRLSELRKSVPDISEKMLIQELKVLVESKLVERKNYGEVPPRVEYSLTQTGEHIQPLIREMVYFAQAYELAQMKS